MEERWDDGLLVVERMLLESLEKGEKDLEGIEKDTGLFRGLLGNLIPGLVHRGIIDYRNGVYFLNRKQKNEWLPVINDRENIKEEMQEMFSSLIQRKFSKSDERAEDLRVQKIWLTDEEYRLLESQLKSLDMFIQNIKDKRKRHPLKNKEVTREKKVIFWGQATYADLVKGTLEAC